MHRRKFPRVLICLVGFAALLAWSPDGTKVATGSGVYDDVRPGVAIVWSVER